MHPLISRTLSFEMGRRGFQTRLPPPLLLCGIALWSGQSASAELSN